MKKDAPFVSTGDAPRQGSKSRLWLGLLVFFAVVGVGAWAMLSGKTGFFKGSLLESQNFVATMLRDHAVLAYDFEQLSGNNAVLDASTINNNGSDGLGGVLNGDASLTADDEGFLGRAIKFDGLNAYAFLRDELTGDQDSLDPKNGDFTIMGWVKIPLIMADGSSEFIAIKVRQSDADPNRADSLGYFVSAMSGYFTGGLQPEDQDVVLASPADPATPKVDDSLWHHFAATFDRDGNLTVYTDGRATASVDISALNGTDLDNTAPLVLGNALDRSGNPLLPPLGIAGLLDEFKLLGTSLSADGVGHFYNAERTAHFAALEKPAPVLSLNFDADFADGSEFGQNVANRNAVRAEGKGVGGAAAEFGLGSYISIPALKHGIQPDGNGTISLWAKFDTLNGWANDIFPKLVFAYGLRDNPAEDTYLAVGTLPSSNKLALFYGDGFDSYCDTGLSVINDSYHHILVTKEGRTAALYIDGAEKCRGENIDFSRLTSRMLLATDNFSGRIMDPKASDNYFSGLIDGVRVYNRLVTADEVGSLYREFAPNDLGEGDMLFSHFDHEEPLDTSPLAHELAARDTVFADDGLGFGALDFNGSSSSVTVADHVALDPGTDDFSVSMWTKMRTSPSRSFSPLVTKGSFTGENVFSNHGWSVVSYCNGDNVYSSRLGLSLAAGNGLWFDVNHGPDITVNGGSIVDMDRGGRFMLLTPKDERVCDNRWHHVAASVDRNGEATLYFDGEALISADARAFAGQDVSSGAPMTVGNFRFRGDNLSYNGLLDELRVRRAALSADQVRQEFELGKQTLLTNGFYNRILLDLPFDEAAGAPVFSDSSGFGHDIVRVNNPTWVAEGVGNGAYRMSFDDKAPSQGLIVSSHPELQVKNSVSFEFAVKLDTTLPAGTTKFLQLFRPDDDPILPGRVRAGGLFEPANPPVEVRLFNQDGDLFPEFVLRKQGDPNAVVLIGARAPLLAGDWNHVVATYADGMARLFVNGRLAEEARVDVSLSNPSAFPDAIYPALQIGPMNGLIDEVRMYNYGLSPEEISARYDYVSSHVARNLLNDGDMEQADTSAWIAYNRGELLKVPSPDAPADMVLSVNGGGAQQIGIPALPGYSYTLRATYLRIGAARAAILVGLDTSDTDIAQNPLLDGDSVESVDYERTFAMPDEGGALHIVFGAQNGVVLFDDVSLTVGEPASELARQRAAAVRAGGRTPRAAVAVVRDSDMEAADVSNWQFIGGTPLDVFEKAEEDGTHVLHAEGTGSGFQQLNFRLDPLRTYSFSFKHRGVRGRTTAYVTLNNRPVPGTVTTISGLTGWETYIKEFTLPADASVGIVFLLDDRAEAYFDDVTLTPLGCVTGYSLDAATSQCKRIPPGCSPHVGLQVDRLIRDIKRSNYNTTNTQYNVLKRAYEADCPDLFARTQLPAIETLGREPSVVRGGVPVKPTVLHFALLPEFDPNTERAFISITLDQPVDSYIVKLVGPDGKDHVLKQVSTRVDATLFTEVWDGYFTVGGDRVMAREGLYPYVIVVNNENGETAVTGTLTVKYKSTPVVTTPAQPPRGVSGGGPVDGSVSGGPARGSLVLRGSCEDYFDDVNVRDPDCHAFAYLHEIDVLLGSNNPSGGKKLIKPDQFLRRAEFVAVSNRLADFDEEFSDNEAVARVQRLFWDLPAEQSNLWLFRELARATIPRGALLPPVIQGYRDGSFRPNNQITNAELWKVTVESLRSGGKANFSLNADTTRVPWFSDYYQFFTDRNLVPKRIDAQRHVTRREAAQLLYSMAFEGLFTP